MKILTAMGKGLKSLFLPELCRCAVCGEEREMVENTGFCQRCWAELPHREEPLTIKESLAVISPFSYTGTAEEMVKGLKFHNQRYLAEALGCVMAQACRQRGLEAEALVPFASNASAHALTVQPVVTTSSTRQIRFPSTAASASNAPYTLALLCKAPNSACCSVCRIRRSQSGCTSASIQAAMPSANNAAWL